MKLCIFDPAHNVPGLKILFPESDFYSLEPSSFFTYSAINHMNNDEFNKLYNFKYLTDIHNITSNKYNTLFIVLPFLDCIDGHSMTKDYGVRILRLIEYILDINSFQTVCIFDTYDYDYDPAIVYNNPKINYYFKRNYNKTKKYSTNVFPFPYMMFVTKCVLTTLLEEKETLDIHKRDDGIFWCGTIFTHENNDFKIYRDRNDIFNKIKDSIVKYDRLDNNTFLNILQKYKIGLDLYGVGDPNKRTFELLASDTLILTNRSELDWGFENDDSFSEETYFTNETEFFDKVTLLKNKEIYYKCLNNQRFLKQKYMNKEWIRNYILSKILNNQ